MAYSRNCVYCGQLIIMAEVPQGGWQPWEPDGSGRHQCNSGFTTSTRFVHTPETRLSPCPWCRYPVYYHTNGYGDSVYFDELGVPWTIHSCWKDYWESQNIEQSKLERQRRFQVKEEQKHRRLLRAIEKVILREGTLQSSINWEAFELKVANTLHLNLKQFRQEYGSVFMLELLAIQVRGFQFLEKSKRKKSKKAKTEPFPAKTQGKKKKVKKSRGMVTMVTCLYCPTSVRSDLMNHHLLDIHQIDVSTITVMPEVQPVRDKVGCPYCSLALPKSLLPNHLQKSHKTYLKRDQLLGKIPQPRPVCPCCVKAVRDFQNHVKTQHINFLKRYPFKA